jgi:hypothetical protein
MHRTSTGSGIPARERPPVDPPLLPALWRMGHYEPGPRGMRRVGMTYADELLGAA